MFTPQITLGEDTCTDEGNVSLHTKSAFNEIANSDANESGPQTVSFQLDRAGSKYKYKNSLWLRISTLMEIRQQLIEFAWARKTEKGR
ncbi:hypothetical protein CEXT_405141 [Caerostris extrusa]|uniref:Uncharacterized protein n=1 Tax=Caerostris extrusa TaxID=172846 RepID=A0AAV4MHD4_CAEEX|nr:hypothetical protein CEXT_405141 [Caerostris extrusa]